MGNKPVQENILKRFFMEGIGGMEREKGTLIRWDNTKGFGFIRPQSGNQEVYLHIKSLPHYQRRPRPGDMLTYALERDERGRPYALSSRISGLAWSRFTLIWGCLTGAFVLYTILVFQQKFPFHFLAVYAAMSLVTIWAYGADKRAAQLGEWRTAEIKLHTLEALGGWPGALLAQIYYRHKWKKVPYQAVFWLIVLAHGFFWYHFLSHQDRYRPYQQLVTEKIQVLINNAQRQALRLFTGDTAESLPVAAISGKAGEKTDSRHVSVRSTRTPSPGTQIVQGTVKEIRPGEGVVVTLDRGLEGVIDKSTLVQGFPRVFAKGERVQVAVQKVTFLNNRSHAELLLVDQ